MRSIAKLRVTNAIMEDVATRGCGLASVMKLGPS